MGTTTVGPPGLSSDGIGRRASTSAAATLGLPPADDPAVGEPARLRRLAVLVVEDDGLIALDIEEEIKALGIGGVRVASCAEEAFACLADGAIDLVLVEHTLESAATVAARARQLGRPLVWIGGPSTGGAAVLSASDFRLEKPFTSEELAGLLHRLLGAAGGVPEPA